jgi:hypothetical protein
MNRDTHVLWEISHGDSTTMCVMVSCCGGAELQVVRATHDAEEIILRELYPDRSSVYERARELQEEARGAGLPRAMLDSDA